MQRAKSSRFYAVVLFMLFFCNVHNNRYLQAQSQQPEDGWILEATSRENYNGVSLANGRIGLVPAIELFTLSKVILANVYEKESDNGVSKIVAGFEFLNINIDIDGKRVKLSDIKNWKQTLNMKEGSLTTTCDIDDKASISQTIVALRHLPYMGLTKIEVKAKKAIKLNVQTYMGTPDNEINNTKFDYVVLKDGEIALPIFRGSGVSKFGKHEIAAATSFLFSETDHPQLKQSSSEQLPVSCGFQKDIAKDDSYSFSLAGGIATSKDFSDPKSEAERFAIFALKQGEKILLEGHKKAWETIWENDIIIEGDAESQKDVRLALYNLFAFSRRGTSISISPMGLSSQGYNGHVFWDTELWMYPPILVFDQDIAKSLLEYRFDRLQKAKEKAGNYGYTGAMFPWESDDTGEEATPTWALTGTFEHHITADVGIAFWNYYRVTKDKNWLKEKGYPVLNAVADFWVSRVVKNSDGSYSIKNVVGADEYAQNVDDNAFTNGSAKTCLMYAEAAAKELNLKPNKNWAEVASKIKFHYNKEGVMLEHATYKEEKIKQGDVNLLAYPLGMTTKKESVVKDLAYYEPKIDAEAGPAMGYAVLSVIHANLGNREKAYELFKKGYIPNRRPPFGVLSESPSQNNPYFATGAGGMLQAVIFGFAGLRLTDAGIVRQKPCLPKTWKQLILKGIGTDNQTYIIKN